ncbi:Rep [uncultured virus]|uniref:ATP-dependent helicase Rep n=1 Tax=uncultured virus TaxID=340016 RepID=A0A2K9LSI9_9VIRU|nr:Rep [uncultured virus]
MERAVKLPALYKGAPKVGGNTSEVPPTWMPRNWCFTLNNPTEQITWPDSARYAIWQKERGENGTEHYQGYVEFRHNKILDAVRNILPRAHWESRRGTQQQAIAYASKEDTRIEGPWTHGELALSRQGFRTDLLELKEAIEEGTSERDLYQLPAMWTHQRAALSYMRLIQPPRTWITRVFLLIGEPGTGKTRFCQRVAPGAYWKQPSIWWDDYNGESDVIIDDFYGWLPYHTMLRLCDRYPLLVESKGGQRAFLAKRLFITSNKPWTEWYPNLANIGALERRIREYGTIITDMTQSLIE